MDMKTPEAYYAAAIMHEVDQRYEVTESFTKAQLIKFSALKSIDLADHQENLIDKALAELVKIGCFEVISDIFGPDVYRILENDITKIAEVYAESPFSKLNDFGDEWLAEALENIDSSYISQNLPEVSIGDLYGIDDEWAPLPLNNDDPEYIETVEGIEHAIQEIAKDNGFSVSFPDERDMIITDAQKTLDQTKNGMVTKKSVQHHLAEAGKWIAEKFAGSALGEAGAALVKWGLRLLEIL